jgi:hypothetical protein
MVLWGLTHHERQINTMHVRFIHVVGGGKGAP